MDANQAKFFFTLLMCLLAGVLILLFFIISIVRAHRKNLRLYQEKIAAEIQTLEKERTRIARDLHDHLGPVMSTVRLQASIIETKTAEDAVVVKELKKNVDHIIQSIRFISNNLRPPVLERLGLRKAIEVFVTEFNDIHDTFIDLQMSGSDNVFYGEADIHLYRIIQELVHNVVKHAGATRVFLKVTIRRKKVTVLMSDNGCGFDFQTAMREGKGAGLKNIVNRIELLKGMLHVDNNNGKGTSYRIDIPIAYEQRKDKNCDS